MINSLLEDSVASNDLALKFIWLLREDVRNGAPLSQLPSPEFRRWWILCGRGEYPAWDDLRDDERNSLAELITPCKVDGLDIRLPKAIKLLAKYRLDVQRQYTVDGKLDLTAFIGWFLMLGLKEHALESIISTELIASLDRPIFGKSSYADNVDVDELVPHVSILMRFVWQLLDPQMQKSLDLNQTESRERFLVWFFCVAMKIYPLSQLITSRWKNWLQQEKYLDSILDGKLPRFVLMEYKVKNELKDHIKMNDAEGLAQLRAWSEQAVREGGEWHWLKTSSSLPAKTPKLDIPLFDKPFGVNLYGYAFGELGIGEDLRMAVAACEAAGIPYRVVNINAGQELRQADQELSTQVDHSKAQLPYAINVFCLPIFDVVSRMYLAQGPDVFRNHYNIGWSPWELSVWPKDWKGAFDLLDEVWAGSPFSLAMYQKTTLKPCYLMPLAASVERVQKFTRKHFKLPVKPFLFLYVFDFNSHLNRKNPNALITAFQKAFPTYDRAIGLVLKIMNANPEDPQWIAFLKDCKADNRIEIIHRTMDRPEVLGLIQACDAYVSPHRAEGFGRTLAEAMLFGKPVVATNYSGNASYMDPELTLPVKYDLVSLSQGDYHFIQSEDKAIWAEPSIEHLAERLKEARKFTADSSKVERLKSYAHEHFGVDVTAKLMKVRMSQIKTQLASQANASNKKRLKSSNS